MTKQYDLSVKIGEYTDSSGTVKGRYQNIGVVMSGQNGPYMLLNRTFNPAGVPGQAERESIIVSMFEPKDNNGGTQASSQAAKQKPLDDDIPF